MYRVQVMYGWPWALDVLWDHYLSMSNQTIVVSHSLANTLAPHLWRDETFHLLQSWIEPCLQKIFMRHSLVLKMKLVYLNESCIVQEKDMPRVVLYYELDNKCAATLPCQCIEFAPMDTVNQALDDLHSMLGLQSDGRYLIICHVESFQ